MIRAYYTVYTEAPPSYHIFDDFHKPPPLPSPLSSISCLLLLVILILILERHNSLWSITLEMDIVFAGAGGGISGGCFELTEPALNCEGVS